MTDDKKKLPEHAPDYQAVAGFITAVHNRDPKQALEFLKAALDALNKKK